MQLDKTFYLLDLERSIRSDRMVYWKPARRGYTMIISEAGFYSIEEAKRIAASDIDGRTVLLPADVITKLLNND